MRNQLQFFFKEILEFRVLLNTIQEGGDENFFQ